MAMLKQDPNVDATMSFLGGGQINQGRVFMQLKPRSQRDMSVDELIRYFNRKLSGIPGIQVFLQNPPPIQIGGRRTKSLYQFTLQGPDRVALYDNANRLSAELRKLPDLINVTSDLVISNPQASVEINRDRAAALGVTARQVEEALYDAYGSAQVSTIYTATSQSGLLVLLILAVFVIYMVLGILYESFIHPITILSALPFAGFGALITLMLFRMELSVYAFVGVIMLVGLVKKNGIMMIDFALEAQRTEGKSAREAILQACSIRFRPIMMTTMAALMGTLPIALGVGQGSESRRPLGIAVVGGLAFSQFITLYVTPVIYTYLDELQQWLGRRAPQRAPAVAPAPAD